MNANLVDYRNKSLFEELNKKYTISIKIVNDAQFYSAESINNTSTIFVPRSNFCKASFTHELLHIYIRSKDIFMGSFLSRKISSSKYLSKVFSNRLVDHIGNCLDHLKMLPIYLELGYEKNKFLFDFAQNKCTDQEIKSIKDQWNIGNNISKQAFDLYLGKYFAATSCPNHKFDYDECLNSLKSINSELYSINEKLTTRWQAMKIDPDDFLDDDYIDIGSDYIKEMEDWVSINFA